VVAVSQAHLRLDRCCMDKPQVVEAG